MFQATSSYAKFDWGDLPVAASLRVVRSLPDNYDGALRLDLLTHEHRPDADGVFLPGVEQVLGRGISFVMHRDELRNEKAFAVQLGPEAALLPYMSARTEDGCTVAVGEVRRARGPYSNRAIQVGAGSVALLFNRLH